MDYGSDGERTAGLLILFTFNSGKCAQRTFSNKYNVHIHTRTYILYTCIRTIKGSLEPERQSERGRGREGRACNRIEKKCTMFIAKSPFHYNKYCFLLCWKRTLKTYYIYIEETACNRHTHTQTQTQQLNVQKIAQLSQMKRFVRKRSNTNGNDEV